MITNLTTGKTIATRVIRCDTFRKRARGLMFRRPQAIGDGQAFLFLDARESVAGSAIHMLFVFFPVAVIWLDGERRVVDKTLARPFRPYYAPSVPARYFVEGDPAMLEQVHLGDQLELGL
jgi:uncharacterized membrane protein (UPF0127 family)